jgi:hypothetical protein
VASAAVEAAAAWEGRADGGRGSGIAAARGTRSDGGAGGGGCGGIGAGGGRWPGQQAPARESKVETAEAAAVAAAAAGVRAALVAASRPRAAPGWSSRRPGSAPGGVSGSERACGGVTVRVAADSVFGVLGSSAGLPWFLWGYLGFFFWDVLPLGVYFVFMYYERTNERTNIG